MKALAVRTRLMFARIPGYGRWLLATALLLLLTATLTLIASLPPRYQVWVDGRYLAAGRDLKALAVAVQEDVARQAERMVTLTADGHEWHFRLDVLGLTPDPEGAAAALQEAADRLVWHERLVWRLPDLRITSRATWDSGKLAAALGQIQERVAKLPVPAELKIVGRTPVITDEVPGTMVDGDALLAALENLGDQMKLPVPVKQALPDVTRASLEQMRITRLIAEWSTRYDPTIPRADNVARAARAFNGVILKPGEVLSYNGTVGPIDSATGWKEAYVIVNGELVPGVGGGVCQVATTFYGAALRANLEILERHPHQLAVTYIDPSQDAAIAQGWEDLKIRNTSLGHLLIETETGGGTVTFRLYGEVPQGQEVKLQSRVISTKPFGTRFITDPALAPGQQKLKIPGNPGLVSEGYRLLYQNGVLVKRELLSRDSYLPTTEVILQGPKPQGQAAPPPPPVVEPQPEPAPDPVPAPEPTPDPNPNPNP